MQAQLQPCWHSQTVAPYNVSTACPLVLSSMCLEPLVRAPFVLTATAAAGAAAVAAVCLPETARGRASFLPQPGRRFASAAGPGRQAAPAPPPAPKGALTSPNGAEAAEGGEAGRQAPLSSRPRPGRDPAQNEPLCVFLYSGLCKADGCGGPECMLAYWQGSVFETLAVAVCAAAFEIPMQKHVSRPPHNMTLDARAEVEGVPGQACAVCSSPASRGRDTVSERRVLCRRLAGHDWQHDDAPEGVAQAARPGWAAILGSADFRAVAVVRSESKKRG